MSVSFIYHRGLPIDERGVPTLALVFGLCVVWIPILQMSLPSFTYPELNIPRCTLITQPSLVTFSQDRFTDSNIEI